MALFFAIVFSLFIGSISSQCASNVHGITNFDINQYLGRWYYFMHSEAPFLNNDCSFSDYSLSGSTINIKKTSWNNANKVEKSGTATLQQHGDMEVSFPPGGGNLKVLETDYASYSVIWTCIHPRAGVSPKEIFWIFSRQRTAPTELGRLKNELGSKYGVTNLVEVNQNNCS